MSWAGRSRQPQMSPQASQKVPSLQICVARSARRYCTHDCLTTVQKLEKRPLWTHDVASAVWVDIITEESGSAGPNYKSLPSAASFDALCCHCTHPAPYREPPLRCRTNAVRKDVFFNLVRILWTSNPSSDDNAIACAHRATAPATKEVRRTPRPAPLALPWWLARSASTQPIHHSMSDPNSRISISHDSLILSHKPHVRLTVGPRRFD